VIFLTRIEAARNLIWQDWQCNFTQSYKIGNPRVKENG